MSTVFYRSPNAGYPIATKSLGTRMYDATGKEWLDMSGGAAVSAVGHSHPHVVSAMKSQLDNMAYAHTAYFTNEPQEQLAWRISARFGEPESKVYFLSGGSEANETAAKMAWQYWAELGKPDKKIIISRKNSYHGNTLGALSLSGNSARRKASAAPLLNWPRVSPCYAYRFKRISETEAEYSARLIGEISSAIESVGAENVAGFICEPFVGPSLGVVGATDNYLKSLRELCDQHEILLIFDEVMCGSGRTGTWFAHAADEIVPDIVTLAKGIAGGYMPLAATVVRKKIHSVLENNGFCHGHTYVGHALACAAGCAVMDVVESEGLLAASQDKGDELLQALRQKFTNHPNVGDIRGRGFFIGIEFVEDKATKAGFADNRKYADEIMAVAMDIGLICYPGEILFDGRVVPNILLAPPLVSSDSDFELMFEKLEGIIERVFKCRPS